MTHVKFHCNAGDTFTKIFAPVRSSEGVKVPIPDAEISNVKFTLRRRPDRNAPAIIEKTLSRNINQYPFSLSSAETEKLKKGTFYADIRVIFTNGANTTPVRLEIIINPTTTAP